MLPTKLIFGLVGTTAVAVGGGGIYHILSDKNTPSEDNSATENTELRSGSSARQKKLSTIRNYLVQAQEPSSVESKSETPCVFNDVCSIFKRNEDSSSDELSTNEKRSNLTKVSDFTTITKGNFYVLRVDNQNFKADEIIELKENESSSNIQQLKVVTKMSVETDTLRMPKPPKKVLPKSDWIRFHSIKNVTMDHLDHLKNKFFNNEAYQTYIERGDIKHENYMVLRWQIWSQKENLHENMTNFEYLPKNVGDDLQKNWQRTISGKDSQTYGSFKHPDLSADWAKTQKINEQLNPVDFYLFKTIEEQVEESPQIDTFQINFDQQKEQNEPNQNEPNTTNIDDFVEIYEIEDQENIKKAYSDPNKYVDKSSEVNWEDIDHASRMITKLSKLEHGKFYKFVFTKKEVVEKAIKKDLASLSGYLINKDSDVKPVNGHEIFTFGAGTEDFYCIKTENNKKCSFFKYIDGIYSH